MIFSISLCIALALDYIYAEAKRFHPLVYFGDYAAAIEARFKDREQSYKAGVLAYCLAVLPFVFLATFIDSYLQESPFIQLLIGSVVLYWSIGWQSLIAHAEAVIEPLEQGDLTQAQTAVSYLVSRDTATLNSTDIAKATTESVLENGADAIFSALFWFLILGWQGVILYRLSNTLDALWGYKTKEYFYFGATAARIDDLLNYIPARLTALSYALVGNWSEALRAWRAQAKAWKSPNAGSVMAAGAGAIGASLGGAAVYKGQLQQRPVLGIEPDLVAPASAATIRNACRLVNRALVVWLVFLILVNLVLMA